MVAYPCSALTTAGVNTVAALLSPFLLRPMKDHPHEHRKTCWPADYAAPNYTNRPWRQCRKDIAAALNVLLADTFSLYLKTKNFHWHVSGSHFRDYHLLFDEQADQSFPATDAIAERVRKIGASTLHSIGDISRRQHIADNDASYVDPDDMLAELRDDNQRFVTALREVHDVCEEEHNDVATASLLEVFIDEAHLVPL